MAYEKQFTNGRLSEIEDYFISKIKELEDRIVILEGGNI